MLSAKGCRIDINGLTVLSVLNWHQWAAAEGIEAITQESQVTKLSQDYFHFSPVLTPMLRDKRGKLVLRPTTEAAVIKIAQAAVADREYVTVRGSGTGNYGQCVPLEGGIIIDMSKMQQIHWVAPGLACVEAGVKLAALDKRAQAMGWECRMVPSTYRTATIGGFIAGGSGGIGSILYGQLRDRGNLRAARVITLTDPIEVIELRGDDVQQVNHAYGVNGIITQLEIPLAPAYPWLEVIITFPDFMTAAQFGESLGNSDGIIKKLISVFAPPIPTFFPGLRHLIPVGAAAVFALINQPDREPLADLVQSWGGSLICLETGSNLVEYTWNHTTLHARAVDTSLTYLQCIYPNLDTVATLQKQLGDELLQHLEFIRVDGKVVPAAIPLVRYTSDERLTAMIQLHEQQGVFVANPHTYWLEDGGMKTINQSQVAFKQRVDPYGLMNPGKMRGWLER